jgi:hypothetical protein
MPLKTKIRDFAHRTLPLSGRQGDWGGEAESLWWPVHSRGLLGFIAQTRAEVLQELRHKTP